MMDEFVVKIENGSKAIDGQAVLQNLNMKVKNNSIYSLFGASGCGKTTLLQIIAGFLQLDSGEIYFKESEKLFGFAPQRFSLFVDLTIKENLSIFAKIYELEHEKFEERSNNLLKFFELNKSESLISDLSGGEKQRVNLIVALLHKPKLLILDEPTANLDIVLCDKIWKFLKFYCVHYEMTIIFTSHSMNEIQQADVVAFLRGGKLLCEDSPENLIKSLKQGSMTEVFVHLSNVNEKLRQPLVTNTVKYEKPLEVKFLRKNFKAIAQKNLKLLNKHMKLNIVQIFSPLILVYIFFLTFGQIPQNTLIKVETEGNQEVTKIIKTCFIEMLQADEKFCVVDNSNMTESCNINCSSLKENASIICNQNLDAQAIQLLVEISSGDFMKILEENRIYKTFEKLMMKIYEQCGDNPLHGRIPINFDHIKEEYERINFAISATPAMTYLVLFFLAMFSFFGLQDGPRSKDAIERLQILKVSKLEIELSNFLIQILFVVLQILPMIPFLFHQFEASFMSKFLVSVELLLGSICAILLEKKIRIIANNERVIIFTIVGIGLCLDFLGGFLWPMEGMPAILQALNKFLPINAPIDSIRSIIFYRLKFYQPKVLKGFLVLIAWIYILF